MPQNTAGQSLRMLAFDASTGFPSKNESSTISVLLSLDGASYAPSATAHPVEDANGYYDLPLTQAETNANVLLVRAASSEPDIVVLVERLGKLETTSGAVNVTTGGDTLQSE